MATRLRAGEDSYEVGAHRSRGAPVRFESHAAALAWVRRVRDASGLRRVLSEVEHLVWALDDERVVQRVSLLLYEQALTATRIAPPAAVSPRLVAAAAEQLAANSPDEDESPPLGPSEVAPEEKRLTWVEFELVGEDSKPVSGERYLVKLPDGSTREGRTDSTGLIVLTGIDPGQCRVSFPDLDREAWAPA